MRTKSSRMRGHTTHGHGSMKKWRGAGNRGGRGNAGTGKRADQNKPSVWHETYGGKHGFTSLEKRYEIINIIDLDAISQGDTLDLGQCKIGKLLSKGTPTKKWNITVARASPKAIEKIEKAGGKVHVSMGKHTEQSS
ncbi:MAG: uL15m family ribosomal protein [Nanoarchaeota archaeon]